jgi:hypothetical protein
MKNLKDKASIASQDSLRSKYGPSATNISPGKAERTALYLRYLQKESREQSDNLATVGGLHESGNANVQNVSEMMKC